MLHVVFSKASRLYTQSSDKLIVEIFPEPEEQGKRLRSILEHLISPGQDVGGDSRLLIPSNKDVVTAEQQVGDQVSKHTNYSWPIVSSQKRAYMSQICCISHSQCQ